MNICYMRNFSKPPEYVKLLAKAAAYYDINVIYSHPKNVDITNKIIHGWTLKNNKWCEIDTPVPNYIDLNRYCCKYKEAITFLKNKSILLNTKGFGSKQKVYNKLIKDGEFAKLIPDTIQMTDFGSFLDFIQKHHQIILKPKGGHKGIGICFIRMMEKDSYKLIFNNEEKILTTDKLQSFIEELTKDTNYLIQKYIHSVTEDGDPFDCRIRLEKNGQGEWSVAANLVRIGANSKIVSNIAQGGSIQKLIPFIKFQYPDYWRILKKEIDYIGKYLPPKIENLYHSSATSFLGIDLGIDREGNVYLFEINSSPGMDFGEAQIINLKVDYYHFLQKNNDTV